MWRWDGNVKVRNGAVRTLWACADVLEIVRDGLIVLSTKLVTSGETKVW